MLNASKLGLVAVITGAVLALTAGALLPHAATQAPIAFPGRAHSVAPLTSSMEQALGNGAQRSAATSLSVRSSGTAVVSRANGLNARVPAIDVTTGAATQAAGRDSAGTVELVVQDSNGRDRLVPAP